MKMQIQVHFGKPVSKKISSNETCRNWDPTDLADGNPWNNLELIEPNSDNIGFEEAKSGDNNEVLIEMNSGESELLF
ncbi:MAG: hypothetical protein IJ220_00425 [Clostridia bacterium]|nr:hypothetical protein [Clostridia bacterium]